MREQYQQLSVIVTDVGAELGITVSSTNVLSSTDRDSLQISKLIVETCEELLSRFPWRTSLGTNPPYLGSDGSYKYHLEKDDDTILIDARLIKTGAKWRYLSVKGLAYAEIFRTYETRINAFAADRVKDNVVNENASTTT